MSVEQARALVKKATTDSEFVARLERAPDSEKRAILQAEGFGDVKLAHLSEALPESSGGELSDEEFTSVVGAGSTTTISASAVSVSVVAAAAGAV